MYFVNYIKKNSFLLALVPGIALGAVFAERYEVLEDNDQEHSFLKRTPDVYVRKYTDKHTPEKKSSYTKRQLDALIYHLSKKPKEAGLEKEFQVLLDTPYRHGDWYFQMAMARLFAYWGTVDPDKALETLMSLQDHKAQLKKRLMPLVLAQLIQEDPEKVAAMFSDSNTRLFVYTNVHPEIARQLTKKSPENAWKWMSSLPSNEQISAMAGFFSELHQSHPEKIGHYIHQLTPPTEWGKVNNMAGRENLKNILSLWADVDYPEAEKWLSSATPYWREKLYPSLLKIQAVRNLDLATEKMLSLPPDAQPNALDEMGYALLYSDAPSKIGPWLNSLATKDINTFYWNYSFVTRMNPIDASLMIEHLTPGKIKDDIITCCIEYELTPDQELLNKLVGQVQNTETKEKLREIISKNNPSSENP